MKYQMKRQTSTKLLLEISWTLSPVRLVFEDSSKRSFMLFVVVSLQLGSVI